MAMWTLTGYHAGCSGVIMRKVGLFEIGGGGKRAHEHLYCRGCGAYTHDLEGPFPTGTNREANRKAWFDGEFCSPDAEVAG